MPLGVQSGEVVPGRAVVWAATDRPARMVVEVATTDRFAGARRVAGSRAGPETGYTARAVLGGLGPGQDVFYRVTFEDPADRRAVSRPVVGRFRTPPADRRAVTLLWSADTAGQGWGIDPDRGGFRTYATMAGLDPDFFVHCGDLVYADHPLPAAVALPDGGVWRNLVTPAKSRVAESLEDFRDQHRYNLLDANLRAFNAATAQYVLWDDHDVTDNWFPGRTLEDPRYSVREVTTLAARGRRALEEFTPLGWRAAGPRGLYRLVSRGPLLDLFLLDLRSRRGPNGENREPALTDAARVLGRAQADWLGRWLRASRALWKVIAVSQPLGLVVPHDFRRGWGADGVAQDDGPPLGRELEIAGLLRGLKREGVGNVVWIAGDVHYCATHRYDPARARVPDFRPFWEFVSGPLHAGGFGPNRLDDTFGPEVVFARPAPRPNTPPTEGRLHFGQLTVHGPGGELTVTHRDVSGAALHRTELTPEGRR